MFPQATQFRILTAGPIVGKRSGGSSACGLPSQGDLPSQGNLPSHTVEWTIRRERQHKPARAGSHSTLRRSVVNDLIVRSSTGWIELDVTDCLEFPAVRADYRGVRTGDTARMKAGYAAAEGGPDGSCAAVPGRCCRMGSRCAERLTGDETRGRNRGISGQLQSTAPQL